MRIAKPLVSAFLVSSALSGAAFAGAAYTYDALGRVISVRFDDGKQIVYTYDSAGNRTQELVSATTVNRAPVTVADSLTLTEDQSSITLNPRTNDSDPDGNALTLFAASAGDYGSGALSGGGTTVTYSSTYKRNAVDKIVYVITDGAGMNASGEITVTLANLPPVAVNDAITVTPVSFPPFDPRTNDSDPGNDAFIITAKSSPAHGSVLILNGGTGIMYQPTFGYTGPDSFTYTITDADGATATATVNATVN
jgi:YD repeat-containing protein